MEDLFVYRTIRGRIDLGPIYDDFHSACERIAALSAGELGRIVGHVREHIGTSRFVGLDQVLLWRAQGIRGLVARVVERSLGQRETRKGDEHE